MSTGTPEGFEAENMMAMNQPAKPAAPKRKRSGALDRLRARKRAKAMRRRSAY